MTMTKDEKIIATVLDNAFTAGRPIVQARGWGVIGPDDCGSCCAVGAGILHVRSEIPGYIGGFGSAIASEEWKDPLEKSAIAVFALTHGVSKAYALGVSDGFEGFSGPDFLGDLKPSERQDYRRGVKVGRAIKFATRPAEDL